MTRIRFVFWDSDNTLTANGDLHWRKHLEVAARHGVTIPEQFQTRIYHNNGQQNWTWLRDELGLAIPMPAYLEQIDAWYAAHIDEIAFRPGIPEALDLFAAHGCRQCVVSNGRRNSVLLALNAKGITGRFDFILTKEDYEGRKPDPAPYLTALARMGNPAPVLGLAIEDDPLGVTSAHGAGLRVLHRRLTPSSPASPEADLSVYDKEDFLAACQKYLDD